MERGIIPHRRGCNHAKHSEFKKTLADSLAPLSLGTGHVPLGHARKAVGQAQPLAQVIPEAQPWAAALWAALTPAEQASQLPRKEAPPGRLPAARFASAARWLLVLLDGAVLPLRRVVPPITPHHSNGGSHRDGVRRLFVWLWGQSSHTKGSARPGQEEPGASPRSNAFRPTQDTRNGKAYGSC